MILNYTPTVLVAEDEDVFRHFILQILEEEGYQTVEATNGEEAIEFLQNLSIDLVITDISMPRKTGLDVLRFAKEINDEIEVIIMTANARLETAVEALRFGAYDYILKPFEDIELILRVVRRTLERQALQKENRNLIQELTIKNRELEEINQSYRAIHDETIALYHLGKTINSTLDLDEVLSLTVNTISELTNPSKSLIFLYDKDKGQLCGNKAVGINESIFQEFSIALDGNWIKQNPIWYLNFHELPDMEARLRDELGITHYIHAPLTMADRIYGILIAAYEDPDAITSREQNLLLQFASHAAMACENAKLHQLTEELSIRDGLTGAYNHRFFQERLSQEFDRAKRHAEPVTLVMIDIDNFKLYNDSHGHPKGDNILKTIVEIVHNSIRTSDIFARYGGEEFALILPNTDINGGITTAEKVRQIIENYQFPGEESQPSGKITISLGLAEYPTDAESIDELIECADKALYSAKKSGRNRTSLFEKVSVRESC